MSIPSQEITSALTALEKNANGRLGVYLIDTLTHEQYGFNEQLRFPFCSTSKVMVVATLLKKSQHDRQLLSDNIVIQKSDLTNYNPITEKNIGKAMKITDLSAAALQYSDNAAMNLLINKAGGIAAVNHFAEEIGDRQFILSRHEPSLNSAIPGDDRDTTTPFAMATSLNKIALGDALAAPQRALLVNWMKGNTTGEMSIKAGLPKNWIVADKTGSGDYGTTNDIAVIWPENHAPLVLVVYFTQPTKDAASRRDVLAKASHIVTAYLQ